MAMSAKDDVVEDSKDLLDDTETLLEQAARATGEKAQALYQQVVKNLKKASGAWHDAQAEIADKAKQTAKTTDQYVHDHPWQSITIAFAVGSLIGMLITRK